MKKNSKVENFLFKYRYQIIIFVSIFIIKSIFNCFLSTLVQISGPDEIGTIAGASYIAGLDWSALISQTAYYGFGYSMFMAPIFLITDNPEVIFQVMIGFNTICLGLCGIIAFNIMDGIFKIQNKVYSALTAFASAMYFGAVLNANAVYNESMLVLIGWIMVYILLKMQVKRDNGLPTTKLTLFLSVIMVYSLLVHTRALYLWGALAVFAIAYFVIKRKLLFNPAILGGICIAGYFGTKIVIERVQANLWMIGQDTTKLNNSVESLGGYFSNIKHLFTVDGLKGFLYTIFGQIYSMINLSGGLYAIFFVIILIGIVTIVYRLVKREKINIDEKLITLGLFIISFLAAAIFLTALGISDRTAVSVAQNKGSKWYLYARYWGMVGGTIIMFTMIVLMKKFGIVIENKAGKIKQNKEKILLLGFSFLSFLAISLVFVFKLAPKFSDVECSFSNVYLHYVPMMLMKKGDYFSRDTFMVMTIIALAVLIAIIFSIYKNKLKIVIILVIGLSIYNYGYSTIVMDADSSKNFKLEFEDITEVIKDLDIEENSKIYVDVSNTQLYNDKWIYLYDAQFWLNRYRIVAGTPAEGEEAILITNKLAESIDMKNYKIVYTKEDSPGYKTVLILKKELTK